MKAPRIFLLASGILLALLAALGFALVSMGDADALGVFLLFDTPHNLIHAALALVALAAGLAPLPDGIARKIALGLGVFYLAIAVLGFVSPSLFGYPQRLGSRINLDLGENMLHLILGGWGAYVATDEEQRS